MGGPGIVVLIDTYPEGCTNTEAYNRHTPILCISEVKVIKSNFTEVSILTSFYPEYSTKILAGSTVPKNSQ